jgi:hypothetical protein
MDTSPLLTAGFGTPAYAWLLEGRIHFPFKIFSLFFILVILVLNKCPGHNNGKRLFFLEELLKV